MTTETERIGLISDVHGNLPALEAVLEDMPEVDVLLNAGDIVGYGPQPNECADRLREEGAVSVLGNHDATLFEGEFYEEGDRYADDVLTKENRDWIRDFPRIRDLLDDRVKVAHGHPSGDIEHYVRPEDFGEGLLGDEDVLVLGHTHFQAKSETDSGVIVNPGSVGQPRDGDTDAAYAVVSLPDRKVSLERVSYDVSLVEEAAEETPVSIMAVSRLKRGR